ncbi:PIG-L family deacetylase [Janibacter sp. GXQ6167]|uniref:PIG-L family deacetylase n=1 Tax=Janibacter sp. GXQ6167 TaxID=3240791 RepID=UPI003525E490
MSADWEVGVVIPARNEEDLIARCLDSVTGAIDALNAERPDVTVRVVVVLDSCTDATADIVAGYPGISTVTTSAQVVGAARGEGVEALRDRGTGRRLWIANTDADSAVPTDWLTAHLDAAEAGTDMVVGMVSIDREEATPGLQDLLGPELDVGDGHPHVYGANLGFTLDAYDQLGGFAAISAHEDVALVDAARAAGLTVESTAGPRVLTSARLHARAPHGLAAYLRHLTQPEAHLVDVAQSAQPLVPEDLIAAGRIVVVVAHPDDETLLAGGLIACAGEVGAEVVVIVASDGEASHPHSPTHSSAQLARLRRQEVAAAVTALNPAATLVRLGLPDGRLAAYEDVLARSLQAALGRGSMIVTTYAKDGHPDHEAVARVASLVSARTGSRLLQAPLWAWFWQAPFEIDEGAVALRLPADARAAKAAAIGKHTSQISPLSADPRDEEVVPEEVVRAFSQGVEVFIDCGVDQRFSLDDLYDRGDDPWRFQGSWYEERKRALTMALFPSRNLGRTLEIGCATGLLTVELAQRATSVIAVDISPRAVALARKSVAEAGLDGSVEIVPAVIPEQWPGGSFDTVLISEVAYFLTEEQWRSTLARAAESLTPTGTLVLVHWQRSVDGWPSDGVQAHRIACEESGLEVVARWREVDVEGLALRAPGLPSVAEGEGRVT